MKRDLKGLLQRGVGQAAPRENHPIERIMLSSAGFVRQPSEAQVDAMATATSEAAKPLLQIAMSGNVHAIRQLVELASNLCAEATMLACMHQDAANALARERQTWPLNVPGDATERRRVLRLVTGTRKLPLGERDGGVASPQADRRGRKDDKVFRVSTPANAALLVALKAIEIERAFRVPSELFPGLQPAWSLAAAQLPDLDATSAVAERWFDVIWMYLCERHGGAPEISALRRVTDPRAEPAADAAPDLAARTALRHALRDAFTRMLHQRSRKKRSAR